MVDATRASKMALSIVTIGAYGFSAVDFFAALQHHGVDTFVDVRQRRGVRGAQYAFANSNRLQVSLAKLGINYCHYQCLAPTESIRAIQHKADAATKTAKRAREMLSDSFIAAYRSEVLARLTAEDFLSDLPAGAEVIALFCVEKDAAACHRSLVAQWLQSELALATPVVNIVAQT